MSLPYIRYKVLISLEELYRSSDNKPLSEEKFSETITMSIKGSKSFIFITRVCQLSNCESAAMMLLKLLRHCWDYPIEFFELSTGIFSLWKLYEKYRNTIDIHEFIELMDRLKYTPDYLNWVGRYFKLETLNVYSFETSVIIPVFERKRLLQAVWKNWQVDHVDNDSYLQWLPEEVIIDTIEYMS